ncbi:MAG: heavy metal-associated domain-containing protein [Bacteroidota bacterium]|nr:heavy metal-associated domain-containing protein [Bacteroidota bacterium]MDP4234387.1 heavy metal-associated domain-containing protein [Bacteroidota bacterium]MDP4243320.1 heavy metal-associated domain-containing protein [Bacteroidota bacterium]MDP4288005.1 heavy metal-associated domain-containing protein [Bacteroidota bacterium]
MLNRTISKKLWQSGAIVLALTMVSFILSAPVARASFTLPLVSKPDTSRIITDTVHVLDMVCGQCESHIKSNLKKVAGVKTVTAYHSTGLVIVKHHASLSEAAIEQGIAKSGYSTKNYPADKAAHEALDECCRKELQ